MQHYLPSQESDAYPTDESALFDRYGSFIFSYILKHISSREEAEDLTLEVFTAALEQKALRQLQPEKQLAWYALLKFPNQSGQPLKPQTTSTTAPQQNASIPYIVSMTMTSPTSGWGTVVTAQNQTMTLAHTTDGEEHGSLLIPSSARSAR
ncbi:RNA polymerase sigma factor [Dictyobacter aurantiacus]|uniref:RNA polymerase sigma-70 region 2 domain-containing protein n=1 Tax=Dictyobacter aurantiacus TaxID=1936993 RepID=A0A401ZSR7_9CHLR|nr:sigma-70 family RNA polymerase sigma factor [Dictyobacter aurantiacus]GCE09958.1 hypothetical protein KDAU_72870 [Dictyobacter aurantiacus]